MRTRGWQRLRRSRRPLRRAGRRGGRSWLLWGRGVATEGSLGRSTGERAAGGQVLESVRPAGRLGDLEALHEVAADVAGRELPAEVSVVAAPGPLLDLNLSARAAGTGRAPHL